MGTDGRVPIAEALSGMEIHPLDAGSVPVEAILLVKYLDDDGEQGWALRTTAPPNRYELLGALEVHRQLLLDGLTEEWDVD